MFYDDFEWNIVWFDVYKDLIRDLCLTCRNHSPRLHLIPHPTLHLTLHPVRDPTLHLAHDQALGAQRSWQLFHWWPLVDESKTWVLFSLMASRYGAPWNSYWTIMLIVEWLTDFLEAKVVSNSFNEFATFRRGRPFHWSTSWAVTYL